MTTKENLLAFFETHRGEYFSGEAIAQQLGVSRTAVWKAVKSLQAEGYSIDAVTNKGYCLAEETDILSAQGIKKYLTHPEIFDITILPVTESTNLDVREKANAGAPEGTFVVSNEQTKGRGRRQRSFYSPAKTGLYMSLLLRPKENLMQQTTNITTMAAVAMCEAMEKVSGKHAVIKWVNDIFLDGKKLCGILTEASFNMENARVEYAVLGIGTNVYEPEGGFPAELKDVATALFASPQKDAKNRLAAEFLRHFMPYYQDAAGSDYVDAYRKRCFVLGKEIMVLRGTQKREATALDVDEHCHLLVRYNDGEEEVLSSGEISIRLKK